ncbi:MAG: CCA tRNA nucleotidyltransferase [candidate division NC10 bacterium]|nr:CCA tRNA nucleotidyltransferase [candidate division NC10 bacterium]
MRHLTRERPSVLAKAILRRLPRLQRDLIETARVLGERRGVSVFLVGGPVRDLVLGRASGDLDLTVAGDAVAYAEALAAQLGSRVTIHPRFGTATLILRGDLRLDLATARRELYAHPAALPQVFPGTIQDDLARRDFTINAMAVRLAPGGGELLDPFGGLKDLKEGLLRALHARSYRDDPTRIFRGARYGARYRLRFSPRDRSLIRNALSEKVLRRLSGDRLFHELKLLLGEPTPEAALKTLQGLGVLKNLDASLTFDAGAGALMRRVRRTWERYHGMGTSSKPLLWRVYLLVLLLSVPSRVRRRVGQHLGLKGPAFDSMLKELNHIPLLQKRLEQPRLRVSRLRKLLDTASADLRLLIWASGTRQVGRRVERYLTRLVSVKPALTGQDLRQLGFPPGPTYRRILDLLLEGRLEGRLKSRDEEMTFLRQRFARPR